MSMKHNIETMQLWAKERHGECLSTHYVNNATHLLWKCSNGHVWKATPTSVQQGCWCRQCNVLKQRLTLKDLQLLARQKGGRCLATKYERNTDRVEWECSGKHRWLSSVANVSSGHWCPYCSKHNLSEEKCRYILEHLTGFFFERTQTLLPDRLELDGYCEDLQCAFEYNGQQHYHKLSGFQHNVSFERLQIRDRQKQTLCAERELTLIIIPYWENTNDDSLASFIKKQLHQHSITVVNDLPVDMTTFYRTFGERGLTILQKICTKRGGRLLTEIYRHSQQKVDVECSCGHQWSVYAFDLKKGSWCIKCAARLRAFKRFKLLPMMANLPMYGEGTFKLGSVL